MTDPIQHARLNRLFDMYDANRDNVLTRDDFLDHAYKLAKVKGVDKDSNDFRELVGTLDQWWEQILAGADTDKDGQVSREELVAWAGATHAAIKQAYESSGVWPLDAWIDALFKIMDSNKDNHISLQEYKDWLTATGLSRDTDMDAAYAGFEKKTPGLLSRDEFVEISKQWWLEFDNSRPGSRWIGP